MLSEEHKQLLIETHRMVVADYGDAGSDPVEAIQAVIDADTENGNIESARHFEENRKEAEQFVAGLMGMM